MASTAQAHDLSIEEDLLPHGTFVRIVCPEKCCWHSEATAEYASWIFSSHGDRGETTTTSTTFASTVPAETTRQVRVWAKLDKPCKE